MRLTRPTARGRTENRPARRLPAVEPMTRYLLRRMGHALFLLAGVSILAFPFHGVGPRETYFDEMRLNPQIAPETVAALRAQNMVFDKPLPVRYCVLAEFRNSTARWDFSFGL